MRLDLIGSGHSYSGLDRVGRIVDQKWYDYGASADRDRTKYGYDQASNRTYRENTKSGSKDELYTYDGLHRLKNFDRGNLNGSYDGMTGTIAKEFDWDLDATGNWESLTQKTSGSTDFTQTRDHNQVNELTSADDAGGSSSGPGNWVDPAYDNNGNMTTLPRPSSLANSYTGVYDAWNRLIEVKIGSTVKQANEYDGLHRRIIRDESNGSGDVRHFYYSQQWQVLEERVGSSSNAFAQYVYGPRYVDEIIFRERDTNDNGVIDQKHYYLQDANFNVTALVNTSGDAQERYLYDPYGEVTIMDGSWGSRSSSSYDNEMLFTGRRVDPETGLQLNRYRFHHQQLGRWVSRDPIGYGGGINLYAYVVSRPTIYFDPTGLLFVCCRPQEAVDDWGSGLIDHCQLRNVCVPGETPYPVWPSKNPRRTLPDGKKCPCDKADIEKCLRDIPHNDAPAGGRGGNNNNCQTGTADRLNACCLESAWQPQLVLGSPRGTCVRWVTAPITYYGVWRRKICVEWRFKGPTYKCRKPPRNLPKDLPTVPPDDDWTHIGWDDNGPGPPVDYPPGEEWPPHPKGPVE